MHCVKKAHSDIVIQLFGQLYSYGLNASLSTWDSKAAGNCCIHKSRADSFDDLRLDDLIFFNRPHEM